MIRSEALPVVILCGGKGTRLGSLSQRIPKPLVPVGGMPIVWHIMKSYAHFGHTDFVLCLGYKGDLVREYFTSGTVAGEAVGTAPFRDPSWNIAFAETGLETATGGRVHHAREYIPEGRRWLLTYGDGVCSVSIEELLAFHERKGKIATVTGVHPPTSFGIIHQDDGVVTAFSEKPRLDVIINGGFFVLEYQAFEYVEPEGPFEVRPLNRLTRDGELAVFEHSGFWQCMDTQKERALLDGMWSQGERPWAPWANTDKEPQQDAEKAEQT